jgi:hypothetical protein
MDNENRGIISAHDVILMGREIRGGRGDERHQTFQ